jgi:hypothetical protein
MSWIPTSGLLKTLTMMGPLSEAPNTATDGHSSKATIDSKSGAAIFAMSLFVEGAQTRTRLFSYMEIEWSERCEHGLWMPLLAIAA